jgi:predicted peroxiredoxin
MEVEDVKKERKMKYSRVLFVAFSLMMAASLFGLITDAKSESADPLFVSLTSNDSHRANMAISFTRGQLGRGHPATLFLNDKGVFLSSSKESNYQSHQKEFTELMDKGVAIYACGFCMKHFGIQETDLVKGIKISSPELMEKELFKKGTRTLTW